MLAVPATADPPSSIAGKRAQAQQALAQVQAFDSRLEKAIEAYDLANVKLYRIRRELKVNAHDLVIAKANLRRAQQTLADRVVALYTAGERNSSLEVLLGATSLDDFLSRVETVDRVSSQDTRVLREIVSFKRLVRRHKTELVQARSEQARIVSARAAERSAIERGLAERKRLLASIQGEIAHLQAVERSRQLALAREARARLSVQEQQSQAEADSTVVGAAASTPEADVAPPSRFGGAVGIAMQYLGTPYVWGGASPSGFDCSGFILYVFSKLGVSLPHNAAAQFTVGVPVSQAELQPGDLVFFDGLGHDGIYIGDGQFIHSPHTGDVVKISSLSDPWYAATYIGARRVV